MGSSDDSDHPFRPSLSQHARCDDAETEADAEWQEVPEVRHAHVQVQVRPEDGEGRLLGMKHWQKVRQKHPEVRRRLLVDWNSLYGPEAEAAYLWSLTTGPERGRIEAAFAVGEMANIYGSP